MTMRWRPIAVLFLTSLAAPGCASALVALTFFQPAQQLGPARLPDGATEHLIPTADGGRVQLFHVARTDATRCVVYFHDTGGHAAAGLPLARALAGAADCDVILAEYRGYGASPGEPSEASVYADARAALRWARERLGHTPARTVLIGRSLGTAVTCEVLGDAPYAGTILLAPFASGRAMADAHGGSVAGWLIGAPFDSAAKLPEFHGACLIIHGTEDAIVPFAQGERLHALANEPKRFVKVAGGTHHRLFFDQPAGFRLLADFVRTCVP